MIFTFVVFIFVRFSQETFKLTTMKNDVQILCATCKVGHESRIKIWRHRRIFESAQEMLPEDGIHVNYLGQGRLYRSVRLAIKTAVNEL